MSSGLLLKGSPCLEESAALQFLSDSNNHWTVWCKIKWGIHYCERNLTNDTVRETMKLCHGPKYPLSLHIGFPCMQLPRGYGKWMAGEHEFPGWVVREGRTQVIKHSYPQNNLPPKQTHAPRPIDLPQACLTPRWVEVWLGYATFTRAVSIYIGKAASNRFWVIPVWPKVER